MMDDDTIEPEALAGYGGQAFDECGSADFFERARAEADYFNLCLRNGVNTFQSHFSGAAGATIDRGRCAEETSEGLNFGSQDYLSLNVHQAVHAAAKRAIDEQGVHSAGSAILSGITDSALALESELADFVQMADVTIFPIGWAAGFGLITSLVRPDDHVVIDFLAHACLRQGAASATKNVHPMPHLSLTHVERCLKRIRATDAKNGILVVTETLFSMDSDVPDLVALQDICRSYGATLFVDAAHDLGAIAPEGRGFLELQGLLGRVDIMMGAFSKSFAANGGFIASNEPALKIRLRTGCGPSTFTNASSPVQVAVVRAALQVIRSKEGAERRRRLFNNAIYIRDRLTASGFDVLGEPSAIVPVILGDQAVSRLMTKYAVEHGVYVNLAEYPAVARNACRWRLQIMADHEKRHLDRFVEIAVKARDAAQSRLRSSAA